MHALCDVCRFGEDHRSLTNVLQDLQGQLKGQEPKLLPGQTQSRPLHVILQVSLHGSMLLKEVLLLLWQELSEQGSLMLSSLGHVAISAEHAAEVVYPGEAL